MNFDEYFDTYNTAVEIVRETVKFSNENSENSCNSNNINSLRDVVCEKWLTWQLVKIIKT